MALDRSEKKTKKAMPQGKPHIGLVIVRALCHIRHTNEETEALLKEWDGSDPELIDWTAKLQAHRTCCADKCSCAGEM